MKKLILSLLIMCSAMAFSQGTIPIPQIIGLPAALASKVDKVTGKSLVADTSIVKLTGIQSGAQVNKLEGIQKNGVDLTITGKKVNITVPTTAAEIGAQPEGTYATGTGTAYNGNNGDETLTTIKTKLGAATSVSDGYLKYQDWNTFNSKLSSFTETDPTIYAWAKSTTKPTYTYSEVGAAPSSTISNATHTGDVTGSSVLTLATVNSNVGTYNNVTINAKGLATAGSNVSYLTGITSGQVTTALGYTPKPTFTENTGFNKPFGTTSGTVLEGRTFGTAANSAVGDFIQNQNSSSQSANININGVASFGDKVSFATSDPTVAGKIYGYNETSTGLYGAGLKFQTRHWNGSTYVYEDKLVLNSIGAATFSSTVNSTGFLLNGNNITSSLTTNYIPKWNGSSFVNATAGTDYQLPITLTTNGTSGAATFSGNVLNVPNYANNATGGTYSPTVTLVSGLSSNTSWGATYTKNGSNYHVGTAGVLTTNATGTCAFRFTLPYSITGTFAAIIPHIYGVSGSYIASSWSAGVNSSTVEITFTSTSPTASQFYYNIMVDYY